LRSARSLISQHRRSASTFSACRDMRTRQNPAYVSANVVLSP
jgi:hypothetical protein